MRIFILLMFFATAATAESKSDVAIQDWAAEKATTMCEPHYKGEMLKDCVYVIQIKLILGLLLTIEKQKALDEDQGIWM